MMVVVDIIECTVRLSAPQRFVGGSVTNLVYQRDSSSNFLRSAGNTTVEHHNPPKAQLGLLLNVFGPYSTYLIVYLNSRELLPFSRSRREGEFFKVPFIRINGR